MEQKFLIVLSWAGAALIIPSPKACRHQRLREEMQGVSRGVELPLCEEKN